MPTLHRIFQSYWDDAEVVSAAQLSAYTDLYRAFAKLDGAIDALGREALEKLGDTSPENIDRNKPKPNKQSIFTSNFRRTYQEAVSAFNIVRRVYEASGYRKVSEEKIPLRIEIDSFLSFVRESVAGGENWRTAPIRAVPEQEMFVGDLIDEWRQTTWTHFEGRIVQDNYPRLRQVFASRDSILSAGDSDLFDGLATLHSFHDRFRFFDGGLPTWKREFPKFNDAQRTRETLAYLVFGADDIVERMANAIYSPRYKLNAFGQSNVQELIGWCNREELPIINGRTTKVLRYFGSKVRQL